MSARKWTTHTIREEAKKYQTRRQFEINCGAGYRVARETKIIDDVCSHMISGRFRYTECELKEIAKKYSTRIDFQRGNRSAYRCSVNMGILDDICIHMIPQRTYWTYESLMLEANKYKTRKEFSDNSESAYKSASERGILDDVCCHMVRGITGFNPQKESILYYIKFTSEHNITLYKIGITNLRASDRLLSMGVSREYDATVIEEFYYPHGKDALDRETMILREYAEFRYFGEPILNNGNTELFVKDILGLDDGN